MCREARDPVRPHLLPANVLDGLDVGAGLQCVQDGTEPVLFEDVGGPGNDRRNDQGGEVHRVALTLDAGCTVGIRQEEVVPDGLALVDVGRIHVAGSGEILEHDRRVEEFFPNPFVQILDEGFVPGGTPEHVGLSVQPRFGCLAHTILRRHQ